MSFSHLGLSDKVLAAVAATGYTTPTPIQEQAIPHVLARRDVLGIAQTGTGKTAAFVLPMLTMLEKGRARARMPRTLILEPTRELAAQVKEKFDKYGAGQKLNVALLIGGVSFGDQDTKLTRGVDVLIATPGRLLDHTERGGLLLTGVELLVIDEADRMLDMGFIPDIERICKLVPFTRQTLFFTATMPPEISRITETFLHNPEKDRSFQARDHRRRPCRSSRSAAGREPHEKREMLRRLLRDAKDLKNAIIFCNRKREVAVVLQIAAEARLQRRRPAWRHGPVGAHRRARSIPQGRNPAAGRLRRRRPRPRHSRRQPRLQFRRAASCRRLRASHRPHRPRRPRRHRDLHRHPARQQIDRRDRKADRTEHSAAPKATSPCSRIRPTTTDQPREHRAREGSREGSRDGARDGPQGEPQAASANARRGAAKRATTANRAAKGAGRNAGAAASPAAAFTPPAAAAASRVPSIGRPEPRRAQREVESEPADHSHLPAFLLRPVRARV